MVVIGAGFAGLAVTRALGRAPVQTVVVDQNNYHLFTPLLYQVGSALLDVSQIAHPSRAILRPLRNVEFRLGRVEEVDLEARQVHTAEGSLGYDYLVVAAGSVTNFFGNPSIEGRAFGLKNLGDALALRNRILSQFEEASWASDPAARKRLLTFAVVGGGPTGVEYAGALSELIGRVLGKDFPGLDLRQVEIFLVEASDTILAGYVPRLREAAIRTLTRKGIRVLLNAPVREAREAVLVLRDGRELPAGTVIWTAGVRGADLGARLATQVGRAGRVTVEPTLQLPGHPEVFVIGDIAEVVEDGRTLPLVIPVAMQEGRRAALNLQALLGGAVPQPFRYRDPGSMATIGRNAGVVQIGRLHVSGFLGWAMWLAFHLLQVISFRARLIVLVNWAWNYFFYDRPVRLIARAAERPSPN